MNPMRMGMIRPRLSGAISPRSLASASSACNMCRERLQRSAVQTWTLLGTVTNDWFAGRSRLRSQAGAWEAGAAKGYSTFKEDL